MASATFHRPAQKQTDTARSAQSASRGSVASSYTLGTWRCCLPKAFHVGSAGWLPAPYLPEHEADRIHHGGLDNLPPREDAPGDSVGLQLRGIGDVFTLGRGGGQSRCDKQLEPCYCPESPPLHTLHLPLPPTL